MFVTLMKMKKLIPRYTYLRKDRFFFYLMGSFEITTVEMKERVCLFFSLYTQTWDEAMFTSPYQFYLLFNF